MSTETTSRPPLPGWAGAVNTCSAPSENADVTGIYCELPEGHAGVHEATTVITWSEDHA